MESLKKTLELKLKIAMDLAEYYHFKSPLKKAIAKHITKTNPCKLIEIPLDQDGNLMNLSSSISGYSINYQDAKAYLLDKEFFTLKLELYFNSKNYEDEEVKKTLELSVPYDLEENFTDEKFEKWLDVQYEKLNKTKRQKEIDLLKMLVNKYPDEIKNVTRES